MIVENRVN